MRLGSADGGRARIPGPSGRGALRLGSAALALGLGALSWSMYAAGPAAAAGRASLGLSPASGPAATVFSATFHLGGAQNCAGQQVTFSFDGQPVASAGLGGGCSATTSIQVPLGASAGAHTVQASSGGGASAAANFTVTGGSQPPPGGSGGGNGGGGTTAAPPGTNPTGQPSVYQDTMSQVVHYNNRKTPTTPWTAPAHAAQSVGGPSTAPCDTTGPHATSAAKAFLSIPAYAVGVHANEADPGSVSEPTAGQLPILNVGPTSMLPPQLGVAPYQSLEVLEPYDSTISPKLRLAAAAGEPFACIQVEAFGPAGGHYGYLVYALKDALIISVQDANADGSPFTQTLPTVASVPTPAPASGSKPSAGKGSAPSSPSTPASPSTSASSAPKAKYELVKLGYTSIQWEYQDAGGANAPAHRGTGTITPPQPQAQLSYSNLVFAFGGLVAATVALMFAYHSRRRDLDRRARRRNAARHV